MASCCLLPSGCLRFPPWHRSGEGRSTDHCVNGRSELCAIRGINTYIGVFACSLKKFWSQTHGCGEEAQLSSGWISLRSELPSHNFDSSVWAKQLFAIRYPNIVITSLYGNLDICLNYYTNPYFRLRNSVHVLSVKDRDRKWKMFFQSRFWTDKQILRPKCSPVAKSAKIFKSAI